MSAAILTLCGPQKCLRQPCAKVSAATSLILRRSRRCLPKGSGPLRLSLRATRVVPHASSAETADVVEQGAPASSFEASTSLPEYPVSPPPAPAAAVQPRVGFPPLVWIIVGVLLAKGFDLASKLFKGGPGNVQNNVQGMMMQKMMEQMMSGKGGPMGGMDPSANPFAGMSAMPGMGGGNGGSGGGAPANPWASMPPFPGAPQQPSQQQQQSSSSSSGFGSSPGFPASGNFPASPAYDTTATPAGNQPFEARPSSKEPKQSSAASSAGDGVAASQQPASKPRRRAAFVDVDDEDSGSGGSAAEAPREPEVLPNSGAPPGFSAGFPTPSGKSDAANGAQAGANGAAEIGVERGGGGGSTMPMLERMMTDENLQKMMYPYLPEPMRNPDTFKWMLNNPEYRQQLEAMMQQQGNNPAMNDLINNFNYDSPELKQQLESIGMTPDEVLQKIMADPDLAMSFSKPEVQEAIMDVTQNQMNITKYSNNPEIMAVFNKMSILFQKQ